MVRYGLRAGPKFGLNHGTKWAGEEAHFLYFFDYSRGRAGGPSSPLLSDTADTSADC